MPDGRVYREHPLCIFFFSSSVCVGGVNAVAHRGARGMESESRAIARGLRRRDPDLIDHLIEKYQHRLLRYLVYLTGNRHLAEDLFQETWIRVLERGNRYDGAHQFSTWLFTIARNLTIDHRRKKVPFTAGGPNETERLAAHEASPEPSLLDLAMQQDRAECVRRALASVPTAYRETLVLRFHEELSLQQISEVTGAPLGTVKARLYRGLEVLMQRLESEAE